MRLRKLLFCTLIFIQREGWLTKLLKEVTVSGASDKGNRDLGCYCINISLLRISEGLTRSCSQL